MIDKGRASLWILASIKTIQFRCDEVQRLISIEELGQQRRVISLEEKLAALHKMLQHSVHLSY
jgi:hypothetical protein